MYCNTGDFTVRLPDRLDWKALVDIVHHPPLHRHVPVSDSCPHVPCRLNTVNVKVVHRCIANFTR